MITRDGLRSGAARAGFGSLEVIVALSVGLLVLGAVYQLMISQQQLYSVHHEQMDARESLRAAATLLSWDLTGASAGDLYSVGANSITLRSIVGSGTVCRRRIFGGGNKTRIGLHETSGTFSATPDDTVITYAPATDSWGTLSIVKLWDPVGGGTPFCHWADSVTIVPQLTLEVDGDTLLELALTPGAPVRAFRKTEYGLFQQAGRWWMGRRVGGSVTWEVLTGPMLAPTDSGLVLTYYDATGAVTTDPGQVAEVEILLRSESYGTALMLYKKLDDSLRTRVYLRNNAAP